jgi:hypothetical protein
MIDEDRLLKNFAKILGADNVLTGIEEKKVKEQSLIKNLANSLGVTDVLTEMEEKKERERKLLENFSRVLNPRSEPEPQVEPEPIVETIAVEEPLVEVVVASEPDPIVEDAKQVEPALPKNDIINKTVVAISKASPLDVQKTVDDIPDSYRKELDIIKKSIADFHRFAQRHSQLGGGGAGDVVHLDHPTKTVYSDYTFTNKDYYVGVGATPATITLPTKAKNGRYIIIKDEVGNCSSNPITVLGTVDNDSGGFILAEDNGGVQMIYNNGSWRIV